MLYGLWTHLPDLIRSGKGEVLELPEVVEVAGEVPADLGVAERVSFTAGDMFEAVFEADGYVMKHVLHDWTDSECVGILESLREAAHEAAPVFVAEWVVPGPDTSHFAKLADLHMLLGAGRERTVDEYGEFFDRAGIELANHHSAENHRISVVEGRVY